MNFPRPSKPLLVIRAIALGSAGAWVVGLIFAPGAAVNGFIAAYFLCAGVPLGAIALLLLYQLVGGRWGARLHGELVTLAALAPWLSPLLLLLVPFHGLLHPAPGADEWRHFRAVYLSGMVLTVRTILFVALWGMGGWYTARRLRHTPSTERPLRGAAGPALLFWALSVSLAAYDWIAALAPDWYSSIVGLYLLIGQPLSALCLAVWMATSLGALETPPPEDPEDYRNRPVLVDWANLLLLMVVLHAYVAFSQFFIIWNGDLPDEIKWYVPRARGAWGVVALLLILGHFAAPFVLLLFRAVKRRPAALIPVIWGLLAARCLDLLWIVIPSAPHGQGLALFFWLAACAAVVAAAGGWTAQPARRLSVTESAP